MLFLILVKKRSDKDNPVQFTLVKEGISLDNGCRPACQQINRQGDSILADSRTLRQWPAPRRRLACLISSQLSG